MDKLGKYSEIFYKAAAAFKQCEKCGKTTATPVEYGGRTLCENCYMDEAIKPFNDPDLANPLEGMKNAV